MAKNLVILPTYNEKNNILPLIGALLLEDLDLDILVVDDSKDETGDLVKKRALNEPRLFLIKRQGKGGRGTALIDGFRFALSKNYERIIDMDSDLSNDPKELHGMLAASGDNTIVIASRYARGSKILFCKISRKIISRIANFVHNCILRIGIRDYTTSFRVYGRRALEKLDLNKVEGKGFFVIPEIAYRLSKKGTAFIELPTIYTNRRRGASNFSFAEIRESLSLVWRVRSEN